MRVLYLGLSIVTFLTMLWTIALCAMAPQGPVDKFYGVHKLEIHDAVGAERGSELMSSISATATEQARWIAIAAAVPLAITTIGWFAMFVTYVQPKD